MFFSPYSSAQYLPTAYNSIAEDFSNTRHYAWKEFDILFENLKENESILDIGCGNGRVVEYIMSKKILFEYHGIDISKNLLSIAQKTYHSFSNVKFSLQGFLDPLPTDQYDRVVAVASFHHLSQRTQRIQALQNIHQSLKKGGTFAMTVWNWKEQEKYNQQSKQAYRRSLWNPLFSKNDGIIPFGQKKIPRYYYWFSESEIKDLLQEAGFSNISISFSENKKNMIIMSQRSEDIPVFFIKNIPFHILSFEKTLRVLQQWSLDDPLQKKVYTPNPEMIVESQKNKKFKDILQKSDLSLADGNGILWAYGMKSDESKALFWKWLIAIWKLIQYFFFRKKYPSILKNTICGSDIFREFLYLRTGKIFLLGGSEGSAEYIQQQYPQNIVGIESRMMSEFSDHEIIEKINASGANVLFVALGAPKQEFWIDKNIHALPNICFAMGVGGSFDFVSGVQKRAPNIFKKLGLEWIYRLYTQPKRWRRIWNATGKFVKVIVK